MKVSRILLLLFLLVLFNDSYSFPPSGNIEQTIDGIIIYPDSHFSGNTRAVRLQVISDKIIRVLASPGITFPEVKSLVSIYSPVSVKFTLIKKPGRVILKTRSITATVLLSTGAVSFANASGMPVVMERQYNGRSFTPAVFQGQNSFGITQIFETTPDDAYYGLGQHQSDQFNYKGQQVFLFQNNTEVAIPFLVSNKNYGILWDNNSITTVGDAREFMPLSTLNLYSKDGDNGWLTASYCNDKAAPAQIAFTKAESRINYEFLEDTKKNLPPDFQVQKGQVTWEGSFSTDFSGTHKFKISYAGYLKIWIDGKLLANRWRQAWNPGYALLNIPLEKNKKYPIKIEWIPDGGESYLSVKWLNPIPQNDTNACTFSSEAGRQLDYYFILGNNMDAVISGYRAITGKATIVPKWAMGFWQSRERYKTQDEILHTVAEFRKRKISLDNIVLDWNYWKENNWGSQEFDPSRFPAPDSMIKVLHDQYHAKLMISVWPKMYEGIQAYKDFDKQGWLYKRNIADQQRDWIGKGYVSTFYDAFNDKAKKGFWDLLNAKLYNKGVDAWWMDASEPDILSNVSPDKRKVLMTPMAPGIAAEYLNAYPLENAKGIYRGQRSVDPNKRVFLLTRSGFAGSQHYAASIWSGDIGSRWEDMKAQISAGINFSMSGLPFWTMDIGGFAVEHRYENARGEDLDEWRELQTRWYQFGAFVPLFRVHGQFPYREVYNVAPDDHPAYKSILFYNKLRYRLMPYIYTLAGNTYHNDYTIMRGLVMDFPNDTAVKNIGDQFMFGPSLLINPVYSYKATNRSLYLPAGQGWYDLYSGRYFKGGQNIIADAPYDRMPVFVKEGSIIPFGPDLEYTSQKPADTIALYIYTGKDASFKLYEDDDTTYNYEKGSFSNIPINYVEATKKLVIGERRGTFEGMLMSRTFKIVWVNKLQSKELKPDSAGGELITYKGKALSVVNDQK
ncbi:MAG: TIM-barrel domain-containing protein [Ginsengibacter sp.]